MNITELIDKVKKEYDDINNNRMLSPLEILKSFAFCYKTLIPELKRLEQTQKELIEENKRLKSCSNCKNIYNCNNYLNKITYCFEHQFIKDGK